MKKTFYFIRHGQTDLNLRGIVQGRGIDSPLNAVGQEQALAFFKHYQHVPFDKIYVSALQRTKQTVQKFIDQGIPYEKLEGLDEISWGEYEGKDLDDSILLGFESLVSAWKNNELDRALDGGESPNQMIERQKIALEHILAQKNEQTILVCTHGRALRILLCHLTSVAVCNMDDFPHTNTALYKVVYENGRFSIEDHYNTDHLKA